MPEDPANDIAALAAQIIEQLAFFREIGVTDIGSSMRRASPPPARNESNARAAPHSASMSTRSSEASKTSAEDMSACDEAKLALIQDRSVEEQVEESVPQVNLFGEKVSQETMARNVKARISPAET